MIVKLNKNQKNYLDNSFSEELKYLKSKVKIKKEHSFIFIELDDETADEIRDWAMDKQIEIGFDLNYELTPVGKILEELADAFYIK